MKGRPSAFLPIALLAAGEALIFWGLWMGILSQTRAVNQSVNEISELKDPSPFRVSLLGHLGKIHLALQGYLHSPDPALLKQVAESRREFDASLPEFERQNPKLFPPSAREEIHVSFNLLKESIDHTLSVNTRRVQRQGALGENFTRILFLVEHHLRPLIRKEQPDGEERSEAVLNIENQLRAWQQNLAIAWTQPSEAAQRSAFENDNRGDTYLERYGRLELLARERKMQREVRTLWQANSRLARESFAIESVVSQSQKAMDAERAQVISTLNRFLPAMPPAQLESRKQAILRAIRWRLGAACALGLIGLVSLVIAALWIYRLSRRPPPGADGVFHVPAAAATAGAGAAPESTLEMNLKGTITAWNPEAQTLYGYTADEMRGQSIARLFDSESEIGRLSRELQAAKQTTFETTHKTKAGSAVHVRIEFRPLTDAGGHTTAIGLLCSRQ